jgi:transglutaminase-like putative cysteine protease
VTLLRFDAGPELLEETIAGDVVGQRVGVFRSQEDQIHYLRQLVSEATPLASIRARARDIVFRVHNAPQRNHAAYAVAIAKWVQSNIQYVNESPEVFQDPPTTLAMGYADCDDMVTLVCALVESLGIETQIVGMEWEHPNGRAFQHIYPRAVIPMAGGQKWYVPLDTTLQRPIENLTDPIRLAMELGHDLRVVIA